jgi:putative ABC transport system substrate-binding protein
MLRTLAIILTALAAVLHPRCAAAEAVRRVAHVVFRADTPGPFYDAVRLRLAERGFEQGRNLDLRFFSLRPGDTRPAPEAHASLVTEVLAWNPDVILVGTAATTRIMQRATSTVPIVFANIQDPQIAGIVSSLARPGGNVTGAATHYDTLSIKRLELIRELLPSARRVAMLIDRRGGAIPQPSRMALEAAAKRNDLALVELDIAAVPGGLCAAAAPVVDSRAEVILPWGNIEAPPNYRSDKPWGAHGYGECLAKLQRQTRVPVVDDSLDTVAQGSAFALGEDQNDSYRRAADVIARILLGAKPGNVPVDVSMRVQLFMNQESVRSLGISPPHSVLLRTDRTVK